ncbi:DUF5522 domain-containing protein [Sediminibacterium ginsengisoli]|uniref:Uncharacterized protein n=1 Tax=Sediminibacterium ginsengisoli TaxID=413434 RepID=A0A1T4M054_9BACT|nr:DUF5522 domain-containing protein [Sediminibacterium ginsengisoli]SJZ60282.1 hypothetical protein SAMN04488132_10385 [Sediminibacterium ginsengisoli]
MAQLTEGVDFYYENGFMVLTEKFHLDKGYCCGNGCRHCPFNYEAVPEPRRSNLIAQRKEQQAQDSDEER